MRFLPIVALVLTCSAPALATRSLLEPDQRGCARVLPTLTADQPAELRRGETATPEQPLLYKAVEHQIGGCSVLVMHQTAQIKAVPAIDPHRNRLMPAR